MPRRPAWDLVQIKGSWCQHSVILPDALKVKAEYYLAGSVTTLPDGVMEHLFFCPTEERMEIESNAAFLAEVHDRDWTAPFASNADLMPHVEPTTPWLGFDHQRAKDQEWTSLQRNLHSYPAIRGWNIFDAWDNGDPRKAHPSLQDSSLPSTVVGERVAAMIQSWLYFGLLEASLGEWFDISYLSRSDATGCMLLYSRNLCFVLYAWTRRLGELDAELRAAELQLAYDGLLSTATCIQQLLLWSDPTTELGQKTRTDFPGYVERLYEITPAIIRLVDAIGVARDRISGEANVRVIAIGGLSDSYRDRNARLKARGWCPFLLSSCSQDMNESVVDWLDASQRSNPIGRHEDCTVESCTGNNVDITSYQMQHNVSSCTCLPIRPAIEDITHAIEGNVIPTVRLERDSQGVTLRVYTSAHDGEAGSVVFSHVWADGLGSTTEKGIYVCQALRLAAIAERTKPGRAWWIDSLSIPEQSPYRYQAIRKLRDVYTQAAKVVVIDKTLTHSRSDEAAEHVLWSIVSSSWNQRLWTFQEAFLPESIDLLFEDDSLPFEPSRLPRSKLPPVAQVVWRNLFDRVASIRPNQAQHLRRKTNLGEVLAAMNWRTTSRKTDETLAAAALLDFDPWSLPEDKEDAEGRMEALLLLVRDLPNDIIFFTCPKLTRKPFRWAPSTLMARSPTMVDTSNDHQEAICTADGLLTRQCFLSFEKVSVDQEDGQYWFRDHSAMAIYGILWDLEPDRQSGEINAVIVRLIEDDQYLRPDVNQMVEGVAVLLGDNNGEDIPTAAYIGIVGITQREEKDLFDGTIFRDATWRTEMLCIT